MLRLAVPTPPTADVAAASAHAARAAVACRASSLPAASRAKAVTPTTLSAAAGGAPHDAAGTCVGAVVTSS